MRIIVGSLSVLSEYLTPLTPAKASSLLSQPIATFPGLALGTAGEEDIGI
jgi:hypothetical protein